MQKGKAVSRTWEVEKKFHVDDARDIRERLRQLGFTLGEHERHEDTYFRHPCRDLKTTDEAFRLRLVNDEACLTYKGPRLKSQGEVKTRTEIELTIDSLQVAQWRIMLEQLGFVSVPCVKKTRAIYQNLSVRWSAVVVALDSVEELGEFAEIEILVTEESQLEAAQATINDLGAQLGLLRAQSRSYLSQLLLKLGVEP
jgi:adenylate cyclase, class 2